jgi:hypothetical protein
MVSGAVYSGKAVREMSLILDVYASHCSASELLELA